MSFFSLLVYQEDVYQLPDLSPLVEPFDEPLEMVSKGEENDNGDHHGGGDDDGDNDGEIEEEGKSVETRVSSPVQTYSLSII